MVHLRRHDLLHRRQEQNEAREVNEQLHQNMARATVVSTIFVTASPTFDGPIAGWSTVFANDNTAIVVPTTKPAAQNNNPKTNTALQNGALTAAEAPTTIAMVAPPVSAPSSLVPTITTGLDGTMHLATPLPSKTTPVFSNTAGNTGTAVAGSNTSSSATSSSTPNSDSGDSSAGTKAGIAFGVLGGLLVIGLLAFFLFTRRKKDAQKEQALRDNEKANAQAGAARPFSMVSATSTVSALPPRTAPNAPQLQLRPGSEFMPTFAERRSSKGAHLALTIGANANNEKKPVGGSMWERPGTNQNQGQENPFEDPARATTPTGGAPANPFDAPENVVGIATSSYSPPRNGAPAAAAGAVGAAGLARKASTRQEAPAPLDLTRSGPGAPGPAPPSPAGTEFSMHSLAPGQSPGPSQSAAAIAADGGPASSVVHRVQLDFLPSLEDELEVRAGQLVRLLHEYDDGWALCIKLDRSNQGVVPRTCLSTRPVKPRPAPGSRPGPPVNPNGQRGPPRGPPGPGQRPMTPQGGRPMTPQGAGPGYMRPESPAMRQMHPQSPSQGRPMNLAQRPGSPNGMAPRTGPAGPGPMNPQTKKPVPGQAY